MEEEKKIENGIFVFDHSKLQTQANNIPSEFIWPTSEIYHTQKELSEPLIGLQGFITGDESATAEAVELIRTACLKHGFFQVINHGVDVNLMNAAAEEIDTIFELPLEKKLSIPKKPGSPASVHYLKSVLGQDFERTGWVYQRYCKSMQKLSGVIFEILAVSLGVDRMHFKDYFEDGSSIMRCKYYPPCDNSGLVLGTGPRSHPTALTILYQDQVGGLEVYTNNNWYSVRPRPDALLINLGDTFMWRTEIETEDHWFSSLVQKKTKVVRPPEYLVLREGPRIYPDFTWSDLLNFTQKHYRPNFTALQSFVHWFSSSKNI
ncbi:putative Gibberellin 20-oxidase [Melia azedarach]|uniref:Gibberellin 20-oxidase n=1 Tax=Melia azedarach TaxID=155640 RepID=A0ACC1XKU3_MELAZ|nr:putative Gibberellin 20-oxidase [Melia azedarach]